MARLIENIAADENFVLSRDGARLFVAGNDGRLRIFDTATGTLIASHAIGTNLNSIALSPDGLSLAITETVPVSQTLVSPWWENVTEAAVYLFDIAQASFRTFVHRATGSATVFADVEFADSGTLIMSQSIISGWSGWTPLVSMELSNGAFSLNSSYYSGLGYEASLTRDPVSGTVLLGQLGLSSAEYFTIDGAGGRIAGNGIYTNDVYGYAAGIEAVHGAGGSGRVAIVTGGALHLYNGNFGYVARVTDDFPHLSNSPGVAFSADGSVLYAIDPLLDEIVGISMVDFEVVERYAIGNYDYANLRAGAELTVAPDGSYFLVATTQGIVSVDAVADARPAGEYGTIYGGISADQIYGWASDDIIFGNAGNDTLGGNDGSDALFGQSGDDMLYGDGGSDKLDGGADNDSLSGGADGDTLRGGDGNDVLNGGAGNDAMTGGAGTDIFTGGEGRDKFRFGDGDTGNTIATADRITDLDQAQGERISLTAMDAIIGGADDAFTFIGTASFGNVAGQLRYELIGGNTYVMGDTDGDGASDFMIRLDGALVLTGADFSL